MRSPVSPPPSWKLPVDLFENVLLQSRKFEWVALSSKIKTNNKQTNRHTWIGFFASFRKFNIGGTIHPVFGTKTLSGRWCHHDHAVVFLQGCHKLVITMHDPFSYDLLSSQFCGVVPQAEEINNFPWTRSVHLIETSGSTHLFFVFFSCFYFYFYRITTVQLNGVTAKFLDCFPTVVQFKSYARWAETMSGKTISAALSGLIWTFPPVRYFPRHLSGA